MIKKNLKTSKKKGKKRTKIRLIQKKEQKRQKFHIQKMIKIFQILDIERKWKKMEEIIGKITTKNSIFLKVSKKFYIFLIKYRQYY